MAFRGMLGLVALGFCVLVLVVEPQRAYGLTRGICASSVIIHGYKCEEHEVTTQDGYILNMQRIPEGRVGGDGTRKQPVLIQHGLLGDGMTWLLNSPEQNLPMILADKGFDVWIANSRGTRFSRRHTSLDPKQPAFWNWSWDELATYDLPAVFEFVYNKTGQKIHYVGHSLGSLIGLAAFSEGRQIDKVKSAALLAPIAYLSHMTTPLGVVAAKALVGEINMPTYGFAEFNPNGEAVSNFVKSLCATHKKKKSLCATHKKNNSLCAIHKMNKSFCATHKKKKLLTALTGKNCCLNASSVGLFLKNEPISTATKNMVHLSQTFRDGVVAKYNYGRPKYNLMHYGEATPPIYNFSNIPRDLPLLISYGKQDSLSDGRDVQHLLDSFKSHNEENFNLQWIQNYAHADFIMGINAKDFVYNQVLSLFKPQV